jgi:putative membrane protein
MMDGNWGHMNGAGWLLGVVCVVLLVAVLVWAVAMITRSTRAEPAERAPNGTSSSRAREILDARFARGEIDETEYETRRHALSG